MTLADNSVLKWSPSGDFSIYQTEQYKKDFLNYFNDSNSVEINMLDVTKLDSAGLQLLVSIKKTCAMYNKSFLISDFTSQQTNFLRLIGLEDYFAKGQA